MRNLTKVQKAELVLAFTAFILWFGTFVGLAAFGGHIIHQTDIPNHTWQFIAVGGGAAIGSAILGCLWFIPYHFLYKKHCKGEV